MRVLLILLLLCDVARATLTVTDCGTGGNATASQNPTTMSPGASTPIPAGSAGVLVIAAANAVASTRNMPLDLTDSVGNPWHLFLDIHPAGANVAVELGLYVCYKLATQLTSSNNVSVSWVAAAPTGKAWAFSAIAPSAGNVALPMQTFPGGNNQTTGTGVTTVSLTPAGYINVGDVIMGFGGVKNADTFTAFASDTTNGSWSTAQHLGVTGMCVASQNKVQTTTVSQQTYTFTWTGATTASMGGMIFKEVADAVRTLQTTPQGTQTSDTYFINRPLAVGSMGVLCGVSKNYGASGTTKIWPTTLTDSQNNTWTQQLSATYAAGGVGQGTEISFYTSPITTALTANDTIAVSWNAGASVTSKQMCIYEFIPGGGNAYSYIGSSSANATTATPSVVTPSLNTNDVVIGLLAAEGTNTFIAASGATNGTWSTMQFGATGSTTGAGSVDVGLSSQYKQVTGAGAQTYNAAPAASNDTTIGYMQIRQVAAAATGTLLIPSIPSPPIGSP